MDIFKLSNKQQNEIKVMYDFDCLLILKDMCDLMLNKQLDLKTIK